MTICRIAGATGRLHPKNALAGKRGGKSGLCTVVVKENDPAENGCNGVVFAAFFACKMDTPDGYTRKCSIFFCPRNQGLL